MQAFLIRLLINALGLWLASAIVPGIAIHGTGTLVLAALLMGVVNALVRPLAFILTLPITILTLGLFYLVVNGIAFGLAAAVVPGFDVAGFGSAVLGAFLVSIVSWGLGAVLVSAR